MISPQELVELMDSHVDMLLLDLRVFPQFSHSRITGAINLCIPTTLLKRPNFNVQKLSATFTKEAERAKFGRWREAKVIVVYDSASVQLRDATSSLNTLKKFTNEGWRGSAMVVRGGYAEFAMNFPDRVDTRVATELDASTTGKLAIDPQGPVGAPVAGGCLMPSAQTAAIPFFGNIRQNMDLIGGVGQMAVKVPATLMLTGITRLPPWLRLVIDENDNGKTVADRFFKIEQAEQQRMQKALSGKVSYGTPSTPSTGGFQIAGFEKGTKNRYKDMLPYDHSRVRLQNVPSGGCDYVNASHIKSGWSHRRYVATQAPVPATFHVSRCLPRRSATNDNNNQP
jgi:protein-tyrosine phosphatase